MGATLEDLAEAYPAKTFFSAQSCPICSGPSRIAHGAFNIHPDRKYRFDFRICRTCRHGWVDPMPSQGLLSYLYAKGSHSVIGVGWIDTEEPLSIPGQFVRENELRPDGLPRRYLELGVGKGVLYRQFLDRGWDCRGVEPGSWGQRFAGVCGDLGELPKSFSADVIVALDVLEHVTDPVTTLRNLRHFAAPNARIYAAMPNRASLRATVGRQHWRMLRPLGHVNYWSRSSVARAFADAGFAVEELRITDLWQPSPIRTLRAAAKATIERLGLGDQWIVTARAR